MFWGAVVKANESVKLFDVAETDILKLCTAVLGTQEKTGKTTLVAEIEGKKHILAHLVADRTEQVSFDLYFRVDQDVTFSVQGKGEVHLGGYFEPAGLDDEDDEDDEEEGSEDDFRALRTTGGGDDDDDSEEDAKPVGKKPEQKGALFGQNPPKQAQPTQAKPQQAKGQQPAKPNQQAKPQQKNQPAKKPAGKSLETLEDDDDEDDFEDLDDDDDEDDIDIDDDDEDDDDDEGAGFGQKPKGGPGSQPQKKVQGPGGKALPNVNQALKQQQGKPAGKPQHQGKPKGGK